MRKAIAGSNSFLYPLSMVVYWNKTETGMGLIIVYVIIGLKTFLQKYGYSKTIKYEQ